MNIYLTYTIWFAVAFVVQQMGKADNHQSCSNMQHTVPTIINSMKCTFVTSNIPD